MNAKQEFANRFKLYRKASGLDQKEYAAFVKVARTYISKLERGLVDIQINAMDGYAKTFGVRHYILCNPDFPIPTLDQMPAAIRRASAKAAKERERKLKEKASLKAAGTGVYQMGMAKDLHALVAAGFFKKARTTKDAYLKLHPDVRPDKLASEQQLAISKMTGTLSKGRFAKLLDKLDPLPGSTAMRFVQKAADKAGYSDTARKL